MQQLGGRPGIIMPQGAALFAELIEMTKETTP
jgi:hypothetical protein